LRISRAFLHNVTRSVDGRRKEKLTIRNVTAISQPNAMVLKVLHSILRFRLFESRNWANQLKVLKSPYSTKLPDQQPIPIVGVLYASRSAIDMDIQTINRPKSAVRYHWLGGTAQGCQRIAPREIMRANLLSKSYPKL
jgi:hypothetical protein